MNFERIAKTLSGLRVLKFFPNDEHALVALVRMVGEMASTEDQVEWLVGRMTSGLYAEWPGPREVRAVFCSRFNPRDGINAYSTVYIDGIPSERPAIAAPMQKALPPGAMVTADESMDEAIQELAKAKAMPSARVESTRFSRQLAEVLTAPAAREEIQPMTDEARRRIQALIDDELRRAGRLAS